LQKYTFALKQDGTSVTGKASVERDGEKREAELKEGKVEADTITFVEPLKIQDNEISITYTGKISGDEIKLTAARKVRVRANASGRDDFARIEVVLNGTVVAQQSTQRERGHFVARLDTTLALDAPGWLALRGSPAQPYNDRTAYAGPGANLFGKALFAHTSAVYVTLTGKTIGTPSAIQDLIAEIKAGIHLIESKGAFASDVEREALLTTYRNAAAKLQDQLLPASP
jgi:hypothetical protein